MKIGLLGAGTIGFGVYEILKNMPEIELKTVLDRREIPELKGKLTQNVDDILNDPEIDAVVELLGGIEPAHSWAVKAMRAGKSFVSANKLMISENLPELTKTAADCGVGLRFSAAVGGGIPYLFNLLRARRADNVLEIGGILNGTTNYMLDLMQNRHIGFDAALKLAQDAGYAEADPTADVSGGDAKCKITLASSIAWNGMVNKADVLCEGITSISGADMDAVLGTGRVCKLLARAAKRDGGISCYVEPSVVDKNSVIGNIALVENAAYWRGENAGLQRFTGAGAGRYATAYAVVNDLIDLVENPGAFRFTVNEAPLTVDNSAEAHRYLTRGLDLPGQEVLPGYLLTEEMSVRDMHRLAAEQRASGKNVFFAGVIE